MGKKSVWKVCVVGSLCMGEVGVGGKSVYVGSLCG